MVVNIKSLHLRPKRGDGDDRVIENNNSCSIVLPFLRYYSQIKIINSLAKTEITENV